MAYTKQGFYAGEPLKASQLEAMEEGIIEAQELAAKAGESIELPEGLATETWVQEQGYLTEHQDLSAYAKKSEIPTNNSQLVNDSNFITQEEVDFTGYATEDYVNEAIEDSQINITNGTGVDSVQSTGATTPKNQEIDNDNPIDPTFNRYYVRDGKMNPRSGALGQYSAVLGWSNTIDTAGRATIIAGERNYAKLNATAVFGQGNYVDGKYNFAIGGNNLVNGGSYINMHGANNGLGYKHEIFDLTTRGSDISGTYWYKSNTKFVTPYKVALSYNFEGLPAVDNVKIWCAQFNKKLTQECEMPQYDDNGKRTDPVKFTIDITLGLSDDGTFSKLYVSYSSDSDVEITSATVYVDTIDTKNDSHTAAIIGGSSVLGNNIQTSIVGGRSSRIYGVNNSVVFGYNNFVKSDKSVANQSNIILGDFFNSYTTGIPVHTDNIGQDNTSLGSWNKINGGVSNAVLLGNDLTATVGSKIIIGTKNDPTEDISNYSIIFANGDKGGTASNIFMLPRVDSTAPALLKSNLSIPDNKLSAKNIEATEKITANTVSATGISAPVISNGIFKIDENASRISIYGKAADGTERTFDLAAKANISGNATFSGKLISNKWHSGAAEGIKDYSETVTINDGVITVSTDAHKSTNKTVITRDKITSNEFIGNLTGNATKDGNGNVIVDTYATKTELETMMSGQQIEEWTFTLEDGSTVTKKVVVIE